MAKVHAAREDAPASRTSLSSLPSRGSALSMSTLVATLSKYKRNLFGEVTQVYAVVLILTLVMACFEARDRALVTDFIASFFAVAALNMFEVWGTGGEN